MKRRTFVALAAALPAAAFAAPRGDVSIPARLHGGRIFATPRTLDGAVFACWLDTDGGGFIFDAAVQRLDLATRAGRARLPPFLPGYGVPPLPGDGTLPVFHRDAADRADPILAGFSAQLGRTWFGRRAWRIDFGGGTLAMLANGIPPSQETIPLSFEGGAPCVPVGAGAGAEVTMRLDIAASVAYAPAFARGEPVSATSFIRAATLERWHAAHPAWTVDRNVSVTPGIDRIVVPQVYVRGYRFDDVAFTTRPGDDVFEGTAAAGKLGANAYARRIVRIDYPNARIRF